MQRPPLPKVIQVSLVWHAAVFAAWAIRPPWWPWMLAAIVGNHLLIVAVGLWPRSTLLGPNLVRLPAEAAERGEVAITIDDGPDPEVTPQVLDLLERFGAKASFFCIGEKVASHPELARRIVEAGHAIENHGHWHGNLSSLLGYRGWLREVSTAQDTLTRVTGRAPVFFRALAGFRNPFLEPVLSHLGLRLCSWTRRGFDTRSGDPERVLARLTRKLRAGDILLLHDGHSARTVSGRAVIVEVLPRLLETLRSQRLRSVTLVSACGRK
jgi:peptidoglycan-N-acetylglucosamine deacetylase